MEVQEKMLLRFTVLYYDVGINLESKDHDKLGHLARSLHLFCNGAHKNTHWIMCSSSSLKIEAIFYVDKYLDNNRRKLFLNCVLKAVYNGTTIF